MFSASWSIESRKSDFRAWSRLSLMWASAIDGPSASDFASAKAAPRSSVSGTTRLTRPSVSPRRAANPLDATARAKGGARTRDQQRTDGRVLAALLDHPPQGRRQMVGERVTRLGAVERDDRDAVADFTQQLAGSGVDFDPIVCHFNRSCFATAEAGTRHRLLDDHHLATRLG